jgi:hypothetical protein
LLNEVDCGLSVLGSHQPLHSFSSATSKPSCKCNCSPSCKTHSGQKQ